jgi:site-specific DNA-methyltransferase (adenine-specific)
LYSFKDDIVIDPFMGSGTTALTVWKSQGRYIGYENNATYFHKAQNRLSVAQAQMNLPL